MLRHRGRYAAAITSCTSGVCRVGASPMCNAATNNAAPRAASLGEAIAAAPWVDAVLLDSGNPVAAIKELGGTGRTHDWQWSQRICEAIGVPTYLAGGLHAGNVADAVRQVRPYGLDICSGVRRDGRLDAQRLHDFMHAARGAAAESAH